ncbi:MAG: hypothetical protein QM645_06310 [Asticcacaulis sp.]
MATVYIETALNAPEMELYNKAKSGTETDALVYGLAILSGQVYSKPPRLYPSLMWRLKRDAQVFFKENQGINPDEVNWAEALNLAEHERPLLENRQYGTDASYWLDRAYMARTTRTIAIYHPPVRTGSSGHTQLMNISDASISPDVLMTAVHCIWAVRMDIWPESSLQAIEIQKATEIDRHIIYRILGHRPLLNIWQKIEDDIQQPPEKQLYTVGKAACGDEARFQRYRQKLQENAEIAMVVR